MIGRGGWGEPGRVLNRFGRPFLWLKTRCTAPAGFVYVMTAHSWAVWPYRYGVRETLRDRTWALNVFASSVWCLTLVLLTSPSCRGVRIVFHTSVFLDEFFWLIYCVLTNMITWVYFVPRVTHSVTDESIRRYPQSSLIMRPSLFPTPPFYLNPFRTRAKFYTKFNIKIEEMRSLKG